MGSCPNCKASSLLLRTRTCNTCLREGCDNCLRVVGHTRDASGRWEPWRSCSTACFDAWAAYAVAAGNEPRAWGSNWMFMGVVPGPAFLDRVNRMVADHRRKWALASAINMVNAERHEDAARIYEGLGMFKEAGEVRRAGRRQVTTQVHVDVNSLIDQIRKAGISTDYACPACGGHIRIAPDTSVAKLTSCEFCGSVIQTTDLVDFLTKVVGYK